MSESKKICGNCVYWCPDYKEHQRCKMCDIYRSKFVSSPYNVYRILNKKRNQESPPQAIESF